MKILLNRFGKRDVFVLNPLRESIEALEMLCAIAEEEPNWNLCISKQNGFGAPKDYYRADLSCASASFAACFVCTQEDVSRALSDQRYLPDSLLELDQLDKITLLNHIAQKMRDQQPQEEAPIS